MFCRIQLGELAHHFEDFKARGAALYAISADTREDGEELATRLERQAGVSPLWFPLLSDPGARTARAWGVQMDESEIAVPATFVVDRDGRVVWSRVGERVTDRPDVDDILAVLDGLRDADARAPADRP